MRMYRILVNPILAIMEHVEPSPLLILHVHVLLDSLVGIVPQSLIRVNPILAEIMVFACQLGLTQISHALVRHASLGGYARQISALALRVSMADYVRF